MDKSSFDYVMELISPSPEFNNVMGTCRGYWNALTLMHQRRIYHTLMQQKKQGIPFKPNPLFVLQDCHPTPVNWNGKPGINDRFKEGTKMVSAKYDGSYGIYTRYEARLFEMTDIKPLN